jgi:cytochrome c oxidase subunit 2
MDIRHIFQQTFSLELWMAVAIFAAVMVVLAFAIIHGRARPGRKPLQKAEHTRTEGLYTLFIAGLAIFLVTNSIIQNGKVDFGMNTDPAVTVHVTGYQWCWRFSYAGSGVSVFGDCIDGRGPVMVVPAGEPVRVTVTSADVVHEWWVPYLRFKMQAIPGHVNFATFVVHRLGTYPARCSEFCGLYHYDMRFSLQVVSPKDFTAWLRAHEHKPRQGAKA